MVIIITVCCILETLAWIFGYYIQVIPQYLTSEDWFQNVLFEKASFLHFLYYDQFNFKKLLALEVG